MFIKTQSSTVENGMIECNEYALQLQRKNQRLYEQYPLNLLRSDF